MSDLTLQMGSITFHIREGFPAGEPRIPEGNSLSNAQLSPFGMSFSEQQEVILETLMAFQERTDH